MRDTNFSQAEYQQFSQYLEAKCGIVLGDTKQYLVKSRLTPVIARFELNSFTALFEQLYNGVNRQLVVATIDAMTTNETFWFRDNFPFDILAKYILPKLAKDKGNIRIWSAACASGQEPYSIAMLVKEMQTKKLTNNANVEIVATDVSSSMLESCRLGIYDHYTLNRGLSLARKQRFFTAIGHNSMQINDSIKQLVCFKSHNLLERSISLGKFDVIFCRNVLIYFSAEMKLKVLTDLANRLHAGGYLFLGASESLRGLTAEFDIQRFDQGTVYQKK